MSFRSARSTIASCYYSLTFFVSFRYSSTTLHFQRLTVNCLTALFFVSCVQAATIVVRPVETQEILVNPGMGIQTFQRYNDDALNPGVEWSEEGPLQVLVTPPNKPNFPPSTVAYCRWHWSTLEPEQGKVKWDIIDLALQEARRHGQRLMIRLMPYDP